MIVQPYLYFGGRCEEVIDYYRRIFGAEVKMMMRFKESPDACPEGMLPPNWDDKVMHAELRIGESTILMSDGMGQDDPAFKNVSLAVSVKAEADADRLFSGLEDGGTVVMPIGKTFFSPRFGMVQDKFGLVWTIVTEA